MENAVVSKPIIESVIGADAPLEIIQKLTQKTLSQVVDVIFWAFEENADTLEYRNIHESFLVWLIEQHKKEELWYSFWEIVEVANRTILWIMAVMQTQEQDF